MATQHVSGSEAVILSLLEEGVDTIFGYPGGAIMPIYDALYDFDQKVTHYLTRHEQGAIHAAEGYAKVTGKVGVCFATSGPGATNLVTGIADAMLDSTPLVAISAQVVSPLLGTDAFQEVDVIGMDSSNTVYAIDIAFHEAGLNYGSKEETKDRVLKKLLRSYLSLLSYFPDKNVNKPYLYLDHQPSTQFQKLLMNSL